MKTPSNSFKQTLNMNICKKNFYHNNILIFIENNSYECVHTSTNIISVKPIPKNNITYSYDKCIFNFYIAPNNSYIKSFNEYFCSLKEYRKEKLQKINDTNYCK